MGMRWIGFRRGGVDMEELTADPDRIEDLLDSEDEASSVDLDKAWHGIHWLLTGSTEPTAAPGSAVIFGGQPIGADLGYGPARVLDEDDVRALARFLNDLPRSALGARMQPAAMEAADVYPSIWDEDDVFDTYLGPAYDDLRAFYAAAAAAGEHVIQVIT